MGVVRECNRCNSRTVTARKWAVGGSTWKSTIRCNSDCYSENVGTTWVYSNVFQNYLFFRTYVMRLHTHCSTL